MDYVSRTIESEISRRLFSGKAIILIGARQVGKSTLLKHITAASTAKSLELNCDDPQVRELLQSPNIADLRLLIADNTLLFIDEAQRIKDIGLTLKLVHDNYPEVQLLVSGSSSFELQQTINEPLTGRKFEFKIFPFSAKELFDSQGLLETKQTLEQRLLYGSYPDIVRNPADAKELLMELTDSYLYKDILQMENVRRPDLLNKLLVALALQTGSEVSYNELAQTVGSDSKTVERYIDLLEKCFVIFRLGAYSRNLRNELKKSRKIYFYDLGVRNAILSNFAPLNLRADTGAIWENYIISEMVKKTTYQRAGVRLYFWRTTQQQEIDLIEESDGKIKAYEFKWNPAKGNVKIPEIFAKTYNPQEFNVITPENYLQYLL